MAIYIDVVARVGLIRPEHSGKEASSDKIMVARSWQLAQNDRITVNSALLIERSQSLSGC